MTDDNDGNVVSLIPQPHGGALRPFTPATGAAARRSSMRAVRRESVALLAEGTPEAASRLLTLMRSDDDRVAAVACAQILDRVLGRPGAEPQADDDGGSLDLTHLTAGERAELAAALATVERLTGRTLSDAPAGPVVQYQLPANGRD